MAWTCATGWDKVTMSEMPWGECLGKGGMGDMGGAAGFPKAHTGSLGGAAGQGENTGVERHETTRFPHTGTALATQQPGRLARSGWGGRGLAAPGCRRDRG